MVVEVVGGGGGGGGWVVVVGGWGWGWVGGDPLFHAFLESYCSLENPLKKGSPALALAHYLLNRV